MNNSFQQQQMHLQQQQQQLQQHKQSHQILLNSNSFANFGLTNPNASSSQMVMNNNNNNNAQLMNNNNNLKNNSNTIGIINKTAPTPLDALNFPKKLVHHHQQQPIAGTLPSQNQSFIHNIQNPYHLHSVPQLIQNGHMLSVLNAIPTNISLGHVQLQGNNTASLTSTNIPVRTIQAAPIYSINDAKISTNAPTTQATTNPFVLGNKSLKLEAVASPLLHNSVNQSAIRHPSDTISNSFVSDSSFFQSLNQIPAGEPTSNPKPSKNQIKEKKQSVSSQTSSSSASSSEDYETRKRERKLAVNREAARASRARKRQRIFELEVGAHILRKENRALTTKLSQIADVLKQIEKFNENNKQVRDIVDSEIKGISSILESLAPRIDIPKTSPAAAKYCEEFGGGSNSNDNNSISIEPSATKNKSDDEDEEENDDNNTESGSNYSVTSEVR